MCVIFIPTSHRQSSWDQNLLWLWWQRCVIVFHTSGYGLNHSTLTRKPQWVVQKFNSIQIRLLLRTKNENKCFHNFEPLRRRKQMGRNRCVVISMTKWVGRWFAHKNARSTCNATVMDPRFSEIGFVLIWFEWFCTFWWTSFENFFTWFNLKEFISSWTLFCQISQLCVKSFNVYPKVKN